MRKRPLYIIFLLILFITESIEKPHLSINLNDHDNSIIVKYFKEKLRIERFLSVCSELPYEKGEAFLLLNNSFVNRSRIVDILAIDELNVCSIRKFKIFINGNITNVTRIDRIGCNHKPLVENEYGLVIEFLLSNLKKLKISYIFQDFLEYNNETCTSLECFFFMPSSPLYTNIWGNDRRTWLRLNKRISPFSFNPSHVQFLIYHPADVKKRNWKIEKYWFKNKIYNFNDIPENDSLRLISLKWPYHNENSKVFLKEWHCSQKNLKQKIKLYPNGMVKYKDWGFYLVYSDTVSIRFMDIRFRNIKMAYEISLAEIVTSYSGFSPFIRTMMSIESMYGIGYFISELSPSIDCPEQAQYFSLDKLVKDSNKIYKVKKAICIFSRPSTKPLRRHFEYDESFPQMKFGSAVKSDLLYVRYIVSLFNYDYIFNYIFHESGVIDISVIPTGNPHVDRYQSANFTKYPHLTNYGYAIPLLDLVFPLHQHLFFFKLDLDVIDKNNNFHIIEVKKNDSKEMGRQIWLKERIVEWENSSVIHYDFQNPLFHLICKNQTKNFKCLQIINKSPIPDLLSNEFISSINWKRFQLAVTKRRFNESEGSSMLNGVNLVNSIINFEKFVSNNDRLVDEDLVAWATIGSFHVPTIEDIPNTITSSNEMTITIKPFNLFDEAPQSNSEDEFFTKNIKDWELGLSCKEERKVKKKT